MCRADGRNSPACAPPTVFYTDGLVEATRDIEWGSERLRAALDDPSVVIADRPARAICEYVLATTAATDDIAVLVARTNGTPLDDVPTHAARRAASAK